MRFEVKLSNILIFNFHYLGCGTETAVENLMQVPTIDQYKRYEQAKKTLVATGKPGTITWNEGGTASCSGIDGTSNVWASALWAIDAQLQAIWVGVGEINFSGSPQALCTYF